MIQIGVTCLIFCTILLSSLPNRKEQPLSRGGDYRARIWGYNFLNEELSSREKIVYASKTSLLFPQLTIDLFEIYDDDEDKVIIHRANRPLEEGNDFGAANSLITCRIFCPDQRLSPEVMVPCAMC